MGRIWGWDKGMEGSGGGVRRERERFCWPRLVGPPALWV